MNDAGWPVVLVTGSSQGLGEAIARRLAQSGRYFVIGISRNRSDAVQHLCDDFPDRVAHRAFDVTALRELQTVVRQITADVGPLYGLVNNAGVARDGVLATMHHSDIQTMVDVNVMAPLLLTKFALRSMLPQRRGRVVNISSIIASTGYNGLAAYGATKAAVEGFTRSLAREVGRRGITVNCVAPGFVQTAMTSGLGAEHMDSIRRRSPLGLATPGDVAGAVEFLLSDAAAKVTGTILTVDGGSSA
jgi:3-oxoacyl-[acyl-carrier protein] reductase